MPRPLRLEFNNAWYHVTNRGAGYKNIFKNIEQGNLFLEILASTYKLFGIEIHAFCLLQNQYHLLIKTPRGNLSRAMRHLNGVYTQRFNRLENTDGALFRGRYKAIVIDPHQYLLKISRYIHLQPVLLNLANEASQYKWSSFLYYLQKKPKPDWLCTYEIISLLDKDEFCQQYKTFVESGVDDETNTFYKRLNTPAIFGGPEYKEQLFSTLNIASDNTTLALPTMDHINQVCADFFAMNEADLYQNGRGKKNDARKIAMYACRVWGSLKLSLIAKRYNIRSHTLISNIVNEIEKRLKSDTQFLEVMQHFQKRVFVNPI